MSLRAASEEYSSREIAKGSAVPAGPDLRILLAEGEASMRLTGGASAGNG